MRFWAAILAVLILFFASFPASAQHTDPFAATNARLKEIVASAPCHGSVPVISITRFDWTYEYCGARMEIGGSLFASSFRSWSERDRALFLELVAKVLQDLRVTLQGTSIWGPGIEMNPVARAALQVQPGGGMILSGGSLLLLDWFRSFLDRNPHLRTVALLIANAVESYATGTWVGIPGVSSAQPTFVTLFVRRW